MDVQRRSLLAVFAFTLTTSCTGDPASGPILGFTPEPAGANCTNGGTRIDAGRDDDGDGSLDPTEVESTAYVCNGSDGEDGTDGTDGAPGQDGTDGTDGVDGEDGADGQDGHDVLIRLTHEAPGANCGAGGTRVDTGLDLDDDGVLDASEITSTAYICDGDDGDPSVAGFRLLSKVTGAGGPIAEIVAVSGDGRTLAYTSGPAMSVGFVDITNPAAPIVLGSVDVGSTVAHAAEGEPTSVAITPDGRYALVTVKDTFSPIANADPGRLVFIDVATHTIAGSIAIGVGPDSIHLTPDGTRAVIAIEDEEDANNNAVAQARPGSVQIVAINPVTPSSSTVTTVALTPTTGNMPTDPQPELVDITADGSTAIVSLQENNVIAVIDLATATVTRYIDAGTSVHAFADLASDRRHGLTATGFVGQLQPDGVCLFAGGSHFITANEGDTANNAFGAGIYSGGRGFSIFTIGGQRVYDSGDALERFALRSGAYPEARSGNRGIELEGCVVGTFGGAEFAFLLAERGSAIVVVDLTQPSQPVMRQVLGAPMRPEGGVTIPQRNLVVVGGEGNVTGGGIWIYEAVTDPADAMLAPNVYDARSDAAPFNSLGALAYDASSGLLLATPDTAFVDQRVWSFWIDHGSHRIQLVREQILRDASGAPLSGYDPEGMTVNPEGGLIIASEGIAANGGSATCAASSASNRLLFFDENGHLDPAYGTGGIVDLPCGAAPNAFNWANMTGNGFEGVTVVDTTPATAGGLVVYVAFQKALTTEGQLTRIGAYDADAGRWDFYFYRLENNPGGAAGNTFLSEIIHVGGDKFAVIERDQGWAGAATNKTVRVFRLSSGTANAIGDPVDKTTAIDLLTGPFRFDQEKIEGLALGGGALWVTNDNDGGTAANFVAKLDPSVLDTEVAPGGGPSTDGNVVINEVNSSGNDFVELKNRGTSPVDVGGWRLTDNDPTHIYTLPASTVISPGAYLLVEHDTSTAPIHMTFGLGSADSAILYTPNNVVADSHTWSAHVASAGRCADGVGAIGAMTPTPGAVNACP